MPYEIKNKKVLVYGSRICENKELVYRLCEISFICITDDSETLQHLASKTHPDLILFLLPDSESNNLLLLRDLQKSLPGTKIVLLDSNNETIARAFEYGITDAFKKPYHLDLILERITGLLKHSSTNHFS